MSSNSQIQRRPSDEIAGTHSARGANAHMSWAQENANLVSPATAVGSMPDGCGVALSVVVIDSQADTYPTGGGKLGLSKTALQRLGHAAGVSWDPIASGRLDNGSHPHYVRWRAVGTYRAFDGQVQTLHAEKELDLRDGSPQIIGKSDKQIGEMRAHAQSHAETKAQLRAIRSLGIKTGYTSQELQKPFVCARIMFTGQSRDPEMQREFSRMTAESFLGGRRSLYGNGAAVGAPAPARLAPPPPVGSTYVQDDDESPAEYHETTAEPQQYEQPRAQPAETRAAPEQQRSEHSAGADPSKRAGYKMPFGRSKDKAIEDADKGDLEWMATTIAGKIADGSSRYPDKDGQFVKAMHAEIAKRGGGY